MITGTVLDNGGEPLSVAVTMSSILPSRSGFKASRSSVPWFLSTPVSGLMVKLLLYSLGLIPYTI